MITSSCIRGGSFTRVAGVFAVGGRPAFHAAGAAAMRVVGLLCFILEVETMIKKKFFFLLNIKYFYRIFKIINLFWGESRRAPPPHPHTRDDSSYAYATQIMAARTEGHFYLIGK